MHKRDRSADSPPPLQSHQSTSEGTRSKQKNASLYVHREKRMWCVIIIVTYLFTAIKQQATYCRTTHCHRSSLEFPYCLACKGLSLWHRYGAPSVIWHANMNISCDLLFFVSFIFSTYTHHISYHIFFIFNYKYSPSSSFLTLRFVFDYYPLSLLVGL